MAWVFRCTDLHKAYGAQVLLDGATFDLDERARCGIIGRNGAGKSTLVKILLGLDELDAGSVERRDGLSVGYLKQNDPYLPGETVLGFLMRSSGAPDWRCGELAGRFLLSQQLIEKPIAALSGGFQTRARLCAMLLAEPDFLVLDEPTNYLDLRTLVLLERFLASFRGGWVIVSHDRGFLARTCSETLAVARGRVRQYPGTVDAWLKYQAEQRVQAELTNANLAAKKRQLEEFVAKNRARATTATRAQSKLKQIERLDEEFVEVEAAEEAVAIRMPAVEARSGWALQCNALTIGYPGPGKTIAQDINLDLDRGLRIAVLGDNGQGKTTFLRTVAGSLPVQGGAFRWAGGLRIGLYAQDVFSAFNPAVTVQGHLEKAARDAPGPTIGTQQILDLAGALLFRGDDLKKTVGVLSGGERARLCLAALLLGRYQVLLLDEPTNHLDVESVDALAEALKGYLGTILFTCHDRAFTATVATQLVEVKDGQVAIYPGDYALYCQRLEQEAERAEPAAKPAKEKASAPADRGQAERTKRQLQAIERQLATLNAEKTEIEDKLAQDYDEAACNRLADLLEEIRVAEERWMALSEPTTTAT